MLAQPINFFISEIFSFLGLFLVVLSPIMFDKSFNSSGRVNTVFLGVGTFWMLKQNGLFLGREAKDNNRALHGSV